MKTKITKTKKILFILLLSISVNSSFSQNEKSYIPYFINYDFNSGLIDGIIYTIAQDDDSNYWFGSWVSNNNVEFSALGKFDGANWSQFNTSDGLVNNTVRTIFKANNGDLWIGTLDGISVFNGITWRTYTTDDGLSNNNIFSFYQDDLDNIWIGSAGGVSMFDGNTFNNYFVNNGLVSNVVTSILQDANGDFWFSTFGGVSKFDGVNWTNFTQLNSGLSSNDIYAMIEDDLGNIWFATYSGNGVSRFDGSEWKTYTIEDGLADNRVRAFAKDNNGNIWFGTNSGISRYDGANFISFSETDGLIFNLVRSLYIDDNNELWIGTFTGVSKMDLNFLSVSDVDYSRKTKFWPNPTTGLLNIDNQNNEILEIEIHNALGQKISSYFNVSGVVDISTLNNGIYYINLISKTGLKETIKIAKN